MVWCQWTGSRGIAIERFTASRDVSKMLLIGFSQDRLEVVRPDRKLTIVGHLGRQGWLNLDLDVSYRRRSHDLGTYRSGYSLRWTLGLFVRRL